MKRKLFCGLLILLSLQVMAQERAVTGTVRDVSGEPLVGASILVKNTTRGTTADANGKFSLNVPAGSQATLVASIIGFVTQEVALSASQTSVEIMLNEDNKKLDELVVVGYGTQKKINLTGAVASIDAKEIENRPITNASQALQGRIAGLLVTQTGGQPGSEDIGLRIRGTSSLNNNDVLVIVDGVAMSMKNLNPNDIESISVLKDAASAAIYGARASGGVILVTTKKGKAGKTRVTYDGYVGRQTPTMLPKMANAYQHALLYREAELNDNPGTTSLTFSEADIEKYRTGELPSSDRFGYLFNPAPQTQHNVGISGGAENSNYYISVGYMKQGGIMRNTGYERLNIRTNNNFKVGKRLDIGIMTQFSPSLQKGPSEASFPNGPTRTISDYMFEALRRGSIHPIFTSDGQWSSVTAWANRFGLQSEEGGFSRERLNRLTGALTLNYRILDGLSVSGTYSGKFDQTRRVDYSKRMKFISPIDLKTVDFDYNTNSLLNANQADYYHTMQLLLNYSKTFGDHTVKLLGGFSREWNQYQAETVGRRNFLTDEIYVVNAGSADTQTWTSSGTASEWAIQSYFGRANYDLKGKYLVEAILRYDGSSRFAAPVRWGLFPSVSAGWRISDENFLKDSRLIDNLKLRASWGQVGNQNVALYQFASSVSTNAYYFNGQPNTTAFYSGNPNPDLTWETKRTINLGVDAGLWNNKLTMAFDLFQDRTSGILLQPPVPDTYGRGRVFQNVGVVDNKGWEIDLRHQNQLGNLRYNVGVQLSNARETVVDVGGQGPRISGSTITEVGYGVDEWFGWEAAGLFQTIDEVKANSFQNIKTGPGDIKYVEHGGNPKTISADDRVHLGRQNSILPYGVNVGLAWKGFDFSAFGQGVGYRLTYMSRVGWHAFDNGISSAMEMHLDRWTPETPDGYFPKSRIGGVNKAFSSFHLQNSAYFRLKNIQLGYSIPSQLTERLKISRLRVYFSGENLLTFTKLRAFDPEAPNGTGSFYPLSKVATFGVNLSL
ncbi:SusC/RagA family TonB-linked outer membrane protein [Persicitalea sp.]|uniref:SusC/RagA family TonB-linked outer membrane protein n=1 Tax=Persicitalea sp. TaxID=3100273 RepID=UPI0035931D72